MNRVFLLKNAAGGGKKVYMYAFNHRTSANGWPSWSGDALHGYEIDHVFGVPFTDTTTYSDAERTLSGQMITYWTNFAKTGYVSKMRCLIATQCENQPADAESQ